MENHFVTAFCHGNLTCYRGMIHSKALERRGGKRRKEEKGRWDEREDMEGLRMKGMEEGGRRGRARDSR